MGYFRTPTISLLLRYAGVRVTDDRIPFALTCRNYPPVLGIRARWNNVSVNPSIRTVSEITVERRSAGWLRARDS